MKHLPVAVIILYLLSACSSSKKSRTDMTTSLFQKWQLTTLNEKLAGYDPAKPLYIEFNEADSRISGSGGCNRFFSTFKKEGSALSFNPIVSTKMYCGEEVTSLEADFLAALSKTTSYKLEKDTLILLNGDDGTATFTKAFMVPENLVGKWQLFYITGRRIAFEGLYPDRKPFIKFNEMGHFISANTGCNSMTGKFDPSNKKEIFESGAMTMMACPGEGEQVFLEEFKKVTSYEVSHDTLSLFNGGIANMKFVKVDE